MAIAADRLKVRVVVGATERARRDVINLGRCCRAALLRAYATQRFIDQLPSTLALPCCAEASLVRGLATVIPCADAWSVACGSMRRRLRRHQRHERPRGGCLRAQRWNIGIDHGSDRRDRQYLGNLIVSDQSVEAEQQHPEPRFATVAFALGPRWS